MDVLAIQNLKKNFGSKEVLRGIDLSVPEHSIFGFIGKNGAGKTTTMKAILGLLKADGGEIYVMGEKVRFGQTNTNRHIGYLPDVPEFYSYMTPLEYLHALSPLFRPVFCVLPQRPCVHYTELFVGFVGRSLTKPAQIVDIFYLYGIFHVCSFPCGQRQVSFPLPFNPFLSAHS